MDWRLELKGSSEGYHLQTSLRERGRPFDQRITHRCLSYLPSEPQIFIGVTYLPSVPLTVNLIDLRPSGLNCVLLEKVWI